MKRTKTSRKTRRTPALPLGLQMAVRHCHENGFTGAGLTTRYGPADALARKLLSQPFGADNGRDFSDYAETLIRRGPNQDEYETEARAALVAFFSTPERRAKCTTPNAAATEVINALAYPKIDVGFSLGLCLGYRLALAGKERVR